MNATMRTVKALTFENFLPVEDVEDECERGTHRDEIIVIARMSDDEGLKGTS